MRLLKRLVKAERDDAADSFISSLQDGLSDEDARIVRERFGELMDAGLATVLYADNSVYYARSTCSGRDAVSLLPRLAISKAARLVVGLVGLVASVITIALALHN